MMAIKELPFCTCCQKDRKKQGKEARVRLPIFMGDNEDPVLVCDFCDGDALRLAKTFEEPPPSGD